MIHLTCIDQPRGYVGMFNHKLCVIDYVAGEHKQPVLLVDVSWCGSPSAISIITHTVTGLGKC